MRASWRLPQALIVELRSHRVRQVVEQLHAGPASTEQGLLFSTQAGMPLDPRNALRSLTTTAAPVRLTDIGLHSPRHAAAPALISSGAHLEVVQELLGHSSHAIMIRTCAALRPAVGEPLDVAVAEPLVASKVALRSLARRYQQLTEDIAELDGLQTPLIAALNPTLLTRRGVGVDAAGQLLVTAGDNPDRLRSEAAFAALTGTSPSRPAAAGPNDTASTEAVTATPTARSIASCCPGRATTPAPRTTCDDGPPQASARRRSSAASSATSPAKSSTTSPQGPHDAL